MYTEALFCHVNLYVFEGVVHGLFFSCVFQFSLQHLCNGRMYNWIWCVRGIQWWHTLPYVAKIMIIRDLVKSVFSLHCCWFFFCWIFHMPRQSWLPQTCRKLQLSGTCVCVSSCARRCIFPSLRSSPKTSQKKDWALGFFCIGSFLFTDVRWFLQTADGCESGVKVHGKSQKVEHPQRTSVYFCFYVTSFQAVLLCLHLHIVWRL